MLIQAVFGARLRALLTAAVCATAFASTAASADGRALAPVASSQTKTRPASQASAPSTNSIGGALGQIGTGLGNGLGQISQGLGTIFGHLGGSYIEPTPGTTSSEGYVYSDGVARRYILIRPTIVTAGAPVLVMLHPTALSPERMANLTRAGRLAAQYGVWVYLPQAQLEHWNDDPDYLFGPDDVAFLGRLLDSVVPANKLDAKRIFIAGYSNGGFMAERFGCERSARIAGIATVAATLRDSVSPTCHPSHNIPVAQFQGTSDFVVPYAGIIYSLSSAQDAAGFWARQAHCTAQTINSTLPHVSDDGTSVLLTRYINCPANTGVRLYTIDRGGHTWPDSLEGLFTVELGRTTHDVDATLEMWRFFSPYSLP